MFKYLYLFCAILEYDLSNPIEVEIHSNSKDEIKMFNEAMEEFR